MYTIDMQIADRIKLHISQLVNDSIENGSLIVLEEQQEIARLREFVVTQSQSIKNKQKTYESLYQEYEIEKYGVYWPDEKHRKMQADEIWSEIVKEDKPTVIRIFDELYSTKMRNARYLFTSMMVAALDLTLPKKYEFIDLGAGDGASLIPMILSSNKVKGKTFAIDLSPSGLKRIQTLSRAFGLDVTTRVANIFDPKFQIKDSTTPVCVLTCFSLICMPKIEADFFLRISSSAPDFVFHFEPNFQDFSPNSLLDQLAEQYILQNDYNTNLSIALNDFLSESEEYELHFKIDNIYGQNPLLPASLICWKKKSILN